MLALGDRSFEWIDATRRATAGGADMGATCPGLVPRPDFLGVRPRNETNDLGAMPPPRKRLGSPLRASRLALRQFEPRLHRRPRGVVAGRAAAVPAAAIPGAGLMPSPPLPDQSAATVAERAPSDFRPPPQGVELTVVVPSFNERDNVEPLIARLDAGAARDRVGSHLCRRRFARRHRRPGACARAKRSACPLRPPYRPPRALDRGDRGHAREQRPLRRGHRRRSAA